MRGVIVIQLLVLVALTGMLARELRTDRLAGEVPVAPPAPEEQPLSPVNAAPEFAVEALESLSETLARPLFDASRRPPSPAPLAESAAGEPEVVKVTPDVGPFILSAIVIVEDERAVLLTNPENGELTRRREGEEVAGWALEEIREDGVVFSNQGAIKEVPLRRFESFVFHRGANAAGQVDKSGERNLLSDALIQKSNKHIETLRSQIKRLQSQIGNTGAQPPTGTEDCGLSRC